MQHEYPSLSERVQSIVIDQVFIIGSMFGFAAILDKFENPPDWIRIVLFFGIWTIYEPLSMIFGCTLGNYFIGLRVRKHKTPARKINLLQAFIRYIIKVLLGWLSFLTINMNPERRAIHDLIASTVMIKKQAQS